MLLSDSDIQLIDQFFDGTLQGEQLEEFVEKRKDPAFEEVLQEHRLLREVVTEKGRTKLKARLDDLESKIKSENRVVPLYVKYRNWIMATAAALLIGFLGTTLWQSPGTNNLYASYYADYPNIIDPLTKGSSKNPSPYQLYEQKEYDKAIQKFQQIPSSHDQEWYLAMSYIGNKDFDKAQGILTPVIANNSHSYYKEAQWYQALILLDKKDIENCRALLVTISRSQDHPYAAKALRLIEEL